MIAAAGPVLPAVQHVCGLAAEPCEAQRAPGSAGRACVSAEHRMLAGVWSRDWRPSPARTSGCCCVAVMLAPCATSGLQRSLAGSVGDWLLAMP